MGFTFFAFYLDGPATTERVQLSSGVKPEHFHL
jgi:hypothetical protein